MQESEVLMIINLWDCFSDRKDKQHITNIRSANGSYIRQQHLGDSGPGLLRLLCVFICLIYPLQVTQCYLCTCQLALIHSVL